MAGSGPTAAKMPGMVAVAIPEVRRAIAPEAGRRVEKERIRLNVNIWAGRIYKNRFRPWNGIFICAPEHGHSKKNGQKVFDHA
jgi:hypothetical protein